MFQKPYPVAFLIPLLAFAVVACASGADEGISNAFELNMRPNEGISNAFDMSMRPDEGISGPFELNTEPCTYYKDLFDTEWEGLKSQLSLGPEPVDIDEDGLPEQWALRLVALILCGDSIPYALTRDQVYAAYTQNLLALEQETPAVQPYKDVLAALLLMGTDLRHYFITRLGLTGSYTVFTVGGKTNAKSPNEPFSGAGDIDHDGFTNAEEYAAVVSGGGTIEDFEQVALYWPGAGPLPVAGVAALAALLGLIAIGGARSMRKK